jgi:CRP/FNR family transcriptional regulator, cyclic AMP receptor protein
MPGQRAELISVLDVDPDLRDGLSPAAFEVARQHAVASALTLPSGELYPDRWAGVTDGHLGFLVLSGVVTRNVTVLGRTSLELLGIGDLLRPWEELAADRSVPYDVSWTVLEPTKVAVLDHRFAQRTARWPEIGLALLDRMFRRGQALSFHGAILENPRVEVRLVLLLWQLADRWGHVGPEGAIVPLRLTHRVLGRLIRAQRPSVTAGLRHLAKRGLVQRIDDAWVLRGDVSHHLRVLEGD